MSVGSLDATVVHPREVFREAASAAAAAIVLFHNHPSGDPTPSADDLALTTRMVNAGDIMGIDVVDHLILADQRYFSLVEAGRLRVARWAGRDKMIDVVTILYFDCFSGASGDMILGALIDAGVPLEDLRRALGSLAIDPDGSLDRAGDACRHLGHEVPRRAARRLPPCITLTTTSGDSRHAHDTSIVTITTVRARSDGITHVASHAGRDRRADRRFRAVPRREGSREGSCLPGSAKPKPRSTASRSTRSTFTKSARSTRSSTSSGPSTRWRRSAPTASWRRR